MARQSSYTTEIGDEICRRVLTRSLKSVCGDDDMPAEGTVYWWLANVPEFAEQYARARRGRAYRRSEEIDEALEAVRRGDLDPNAGRVVIDAMKWQAAKEFPGGFGDKIEHTGPGGGAILVQAVTGVPQVEPSPDGADADR